MDSRTQKRLKSGEIDMSSTEYPSFLWSDNGDGFDEQNILKGLFHGFFLERVSAMYVSWGNN